MGRPAAEKADRRTERLEIRCTPGERHLLGREADAAGLPVGTWLRELGIERAAPVRVDAPFPPCPHCGHVFVGMPVPRVGYEFGCVRCAAPLIMAADAEGERHADPLDLADSEAGPDGWARVFDEVREMASYSPEAEAARKDESTSTDGD